jgi:hypothetical protein
MTLASTLSRVFQVGKVAGTEVVSGKGFAGQNAFQVRFKLFQVRSGSRWESVCCECVTEEQVENRQK